MQTIIMYFCSVFFVLFAFLSPSPFVGADLQSTVNIMDTSTVTGQKTKIISQSPDLARSKKYMYLAGASYCFNLQDWDCVFCKTAKSNGYEFAGVVNNSAAGTFAFITVNKSLKEIVVAFRGTFNVPNVIEDFTLNQVSPPGSCSSSSNKRGKRALISKIRDAGKKLKAKLSPKTSSLTNSNSSCQIKVHNGFLIATQSLYPQVVKKLAALLKANKNYNVILIGHSLGASMASITLYMLQQKVKLPNGFHTPASYAYFGYGEPRVGNQAYADYWNKQSIQISRITNKKDPVPHIPLASLGYVHHGTELWVKSDGSTKTAKQNIYEDPTCSNSQSPVYNLIDHVKYWDVDVSTCAAENPVKVLFQLVTPI